MKQGIVWSKSKDKLRVDDMVYVVNQTLMFGDLSDISELIKKYGESEIKNIFLEQPLKVYSRSGVNFVSKIILGIKKDIDYSRYVKNLY